ncbi:MAG TPA: MarR family transcriptional regulator [Chloroflexota bacterium]|nr:MarR family transcriptional regulator [Chloroflexota bacterium]
MDQIEECISFLLGKAYQQVNQVARKRLAPYGITPMQFALLKVLWQRDGQSGADLGERLRLDAATITGILDRLEQAGLIARRAHPSDRRVNSVFLTGPGWALQGTVDPAMEALNQEIFGRFSGEDAARLRMLLAELGGAAVSEEAAAVARGDNR